MKRTITNTFTDESDVLIQHNTIKKVLFGEYYDMNVVIKSIPEIIFGESYFEVHWSIYNIDVEYSVFDINRQTHYHIKEHLSQADLQDWDIIFPDCENFGKQNSIQKVSINFIDKQILL